MSMNIGSTPEEQKKNRSCVLLLNEPGEERESVYLSRLFLIPTDCLIPEGTYVFLIYDAKYDEEFGKIEVKLVNAQGMTHTERFSIKDKNDEYNEKALNAFSYFAKTAMPSVVSSSPLTLTYISTQSFFSISV